MEAHSEFLAVYIDPTIRVPDVKVQLKPYGEVHKFSCFAVLAATDMPKTYVLFENGYNSKVHHCENCPGCVPYSLDGLKICGTTSKSICPTVDQIQSHFRDS